MDRKKLLKRILILILFIFVINYIAGSLYWYTSIWWFDMPMHFLGGFWVGLASFWLFFRESFRLSLGEILKILLVVLAVGVAWEIFEVLVNNVVAHNPFNVLDTISDILFDLAGGAFAFLYCMKHIMPTTPSPSLIKEGRNSATLSF